MKRSMTFSESIDGMHWWTCDLCGKEVAMLTLKQHDDECLCTKCTLAELRAEAELYEAIKRNSTGEKLVFDNSKEQDFKDMLIKK